MILNQERINQDRFPDFPCRVGDFKLYIPSGADLNFFTYLLEQPQTYEARIINMCGGASEIVTFNKYVISQDDDARFYFVADGLLIEDLPSAFRIAIRFDYECNFQWFYSEVYYSESCQSIKMVESVGDISDDIYSGMPQGEFIGDSSLYYTYRAFITNAELKLIGYSTTFTSNSRRNFKSEKVKTYELRSRLVPQWYMNYLNDLFSRGDIAIDKQMYQVSSIDAKLISECRELWKPWITLVESDKRYFGCESRTPNLCQIITAIIGCVEDYEEVCETATGVDYEFVSDDIITPTLLNQYCVIGQSGEICTASYQLISSIDTVISVNFLLEALGTLGSTRTALSQIIIKSNSTIVFTESITNATLSNIIDVSIIAGEIIEIELNVEAIDSSYIGTVIANAMFNIVNSTNTEFDQGEYSINANCC